MPQECSLCLDQKSDFWGHPPLTILPQLKDQVYYIRVDADHFQNTKHLSLEQQQEGATFVHMHAVCTDCFLKHDLEKCSTCKDPTPFESKRVKIIKDHLNSQNLDHSPYSIWSVLDLLQPYAAQSQDPTQAHPPPSAAPAATFVTGGAATQSFAPPVGSQQSGNASSASLGGVPQFTRRIDEIVHIEQHRRPRQLSWMEKMALGALVIGGFAVTILLLQHAGVIPSFQTLKSMYADKRNAINASPSIESWLTSSIERIQERFRHAFSPETTSQVHKSAGATSSFVKKALSPEVTPLHAYYPQLRNALGSRH